ncbi:MAG: hypothetical protein ACYDCN_15760 [Bacteroidia bacterium]
MTSKLKHFAFFILMALVLSFLSCKKTTTQHAQNNALLVLAANTHFTNTVLLSSHPNLAGYPSSDTISNVAMNAGIRGLLIYRASQTDFYAYERACTYDGTTNANAKVTSATNGSFTCKDNVCGSIFIISDGSGLPSHGPATFALKRYTVNYDPANPNVLTITN